MKASSEYLEEIKNRIIEHEHPLKIILFGSHARGDATWESDIDLLVVLPKVEHKRKDAVRIRGLLRDLPMGKDIYVTMPEEIVRRSDILGTLLNEAIREGKVIYEQS